MTDESKDLDRHIEDSDEQLAEEAVENNSTEEAETVTISKAELELLNKRRDIATSKHREAQRELKELKAAEDRKKKDAAEKNQDFEAYKKMSEEQFGGLRSQYEAALEEIRDLRLEREVSALAKNSNIVPKGIDVFLKLNKSELEAVRDEDGQYHIQSKSGLSVAEKLDMFKSEYEMFVSNPLKSGSGLKQSRNSSSSPSREALLKEYQSFGNNELERRKFLLKHPELMKGT